MFEGRPGGSLLLNGSGLDGSDGFGRGSIVRLDNKPKTAVTSSVFFMTVRRWMYSLCARLLEKGMNNCTTGYACYSSDKDRGRKGAKRRSKCGAVASMAPGFA